MGLDHPDEIWIHWPVFKQRQPIIFLGHVRIGTLWGCGGAIRGAEGLEPRAGWNRMGAMVAVGFCWTCWYTTRGNGALGRFNSSSQ